MRRFATRFPARERSPLTFNIFANRNSAQNVSLDKKFLPRNPTSRPYPRQDRLQSLTKLLLHRSHFPETSQLDESDRVSREEATQRLCDFSHIFHGSKLAFQSLNISSRAVASANFKRLRKDSMNLRFVLGRRCAIV